MEELLTAGVLVLCVSAGEFLLRFVWPLPEVYRVLPPSEERTTAIPPGALAGVSDPAHFITDSLGVRGDELGPEADVAILAVGGSTTEDVALDQHETWTAHLQAGLNTAQRRHRVWVGNAARSGHCTRDTVLQVRELLHTVPQSKWVIVLAGGNDFLRRLAEDERYRPSFDEGPEAERDRISRAFASFPMLRTGAPPLARSQIWARIRLLGHRVLGWLHAHRTGTSSEDAVQNILRWRENRRHGMAIRERLPDLTTGLEDYAANLRRIVAAVRDAGAIPVLVTQPTIWRADLPSELDRMLWLGGVGDFQRSDVRAEYYSPAALAEGILRYNDRMLEVCVSEPGALCFDLARKLPRDESVFYDDLHFNEAGASRVADELVALLLPQLN